MKILDFENEQTLEREEVARLLHEFAETLGRNNQLAFEREGRKYKVAVPKEIAMEIEIEIGEDGTSVEIELSW